MDNQHMLIKGYRDLSEVEITAINQVKQVANITGDLIKILETVPGIDRRWLSIAQTDLQKGFMSLTRSIAQPITF